MSKRRKTHLKVIPPPKQGTRTVFLPEGAPIIKGVGNLDMLCGKCNELLIEGINEGQVRNMVIRCPTCGSYNNIP